MTMLALRRMRGHGAPREAVKGSAWHRASGPQGATKGGSLQHRSGLRVQRCFRVDPSQPRTMQRVKHLK